MTKSLGQIAYESLIGSPAASWEGVDAWHRALYESCAQAVAAHVRAEDAKQAAIPQWQDIATAPKDETPVYLWADGECMPNMVRVDLGAGNVFYDAIKSGYLSITTATHWMPVPPQPRTKQLPGDLPEINLSNYGENPTCVLAQRVVDAAKVYYERYAQDEANDAQDGWNCTGCSDKQSADAVELRNALAALTAGPDARLVALTQPKPDAMKQLPTDMAKILEENRVELYSRTDKSPTP